MSTTPQSHRPLGRTGRLGVAVASLIATGFGLTVLGSSTAFAQGTHHVHTAKARVSTHEHRESANVRASETILTDPTSTGPNESTDPTSTDPSAGDEGSGDMSVSDVNESTDSTSTDSSSIVVVANHA
jgi:hypothetical protein